jgi:hypothetical protein
MLRPEPPARGARIFLSYSAKDRDFVQRLALDLTQRGFRVWLDSWHMGIGEHLTQSVRQGVNSSAFLVVVLSPHTSKSKWVSDELDWATAREREQGRKILLPVRIGGGKVPKQIRDRIFADFTDSYSDALRKLESRLQAWSQAKPAPFDIADVDIPIFLDDGLDVDVYALGHCLTRISTQLLESALGRQRPLDWTLCEGEELTATQVHLQPSKTYDRLRRSALSRVELLTHETGLRPEERQSLSLHARRALALEQHLLKGAAKLLSVGIPLGSGSPALGSTPGFSGAYACGAFILLQRARLLMTFYFLMSAADQKTFPNVLTRCHFRPMMDARSAAHVYGLDAMLAVHAVPPGMSNYQGHHVFIPADCAQAREVMSVGQVTMDDSIDSMRLLSRFVVPQAIDASELSDVEQYGGFALANFPSAWDRCRLLAS